MKYFKNKLLLIILFISCNQLNTGTSQNVRSSDQDNNQTKYQSPSPSLLGSQQTETNTNNRTPVSVVNLRNRLDNRLLNKYGLENQDITFINNSPIITNRHKLYFIKKKKESDPQLALISEILPTEFSNINLVSVTFSEDEDLIQYLNLPNESQKARFHIYEDLCNNKALHISKQLRGGFFRWFYRKVIRPVYNGAAKLVDRVLPRGTVTKKMPDWHLSGDGDEGGGGGGMFLGLFKTIQRAFKRHEREEYIKKQELKRKINYFKERKREQEFFFEVMRNSNRDSPYYRRIKEKLKATEQILEKLLKKYYKQYPKEKPRYTNTKKNRQENKRRSTILDDEERKEREPLFPDGDNHPMVSNIKGYNDEGYGDSNLTFGYGDENEEEFNYSPPPGDENEEEFNYSPPSGDENEEEFNYSPPLGDGNEEECNYSPPLGDGNEEECNYSPPSGDENEEEFDYSSPSEDERSRSKSRCEKSSKKVKKYLKSKNKCKKSNKKCKEFWKSKKCKYALIILGIAALIVIAVLLIVYLAPLAAAGGAVAASGTTAAGGAAGAAVGGAAGAAVGGAAGAAAVGGAAGAAVGGVAGAAVGGVVGAAIGGVAGAAIGGTAMSLTGFLYTGFALSAIILTSIYAPGLWGKQKKEHYKPVEQEYFFGDDNQILFDPLCSTYNGEFFKKHGLGSRPLLINENIEPNSNSSKSPNFTDNTEMEEDQEIQDSMDTASNSFPITSINNNVKAPERQYILNTKEVDLSQELIPNSSSSINEVDDLNVLQKSFDGKLQFIGEVIETCGDSYKSFGEKYPFLYKGAEFLKKGFLYGTMLTNFSPQALLMTSVFDYIINNTKIFKKGFIKIKELVSKYLRKIDTKLKEKYANILSSKIVYLLKNRLTRKLTKGVDSLNNSSKLKFPKNAKVKTNGFSGGIRSKGAGSNSNKTNTRFKGKNKKVSFKKPDAKELARRLNTDEKTFHRKIKNDIESDFSKKLSAKNIKNPDICVDHKGNIVLKHPTKNIFIETDTPLGFYKK